MSEYSIIENAFSNCKLLSFIHRIRQIENTLNIKNEICPILDLCEWWMSLEQNNINLENFDDSHPIYVLSVKYTTYFTTFIRYIVVY